MSGFTEAGVELLGLLTEAEYAFTPVTPATHARVVGRAHRSRARDLRDVFGWSLPFAPDLLPLDLLAALCSLGGVEREHDLFRSKVRVAKVRGHLFLHSAYPTIEEDAVFLGPDTLRFVDYVSAEMLGGPSPGRIVDLGAGAGVGGIIAGLSKPSARLTLVDVNPRALSFSRVNAARAGVDADFVESAGLDGVRNPFDLVLANPPFIMDDDRTRRYRHGGGLHGGEVSAEWVRAAARRLPPGGRLIMYTGSAVVDGRSPLLEQLAREAPALGCELHQREIDPDIFGEELARPEYGDVERIAAVGLVVKRL